jgi:hypothetical protein
MTSRRVDAVDPRVHAVRTLAALLVRHAPRKGEPDPLPPGGPADADADPVARPARRAA